MICIPFFCSEQVLVSNGIVCYGNGITSRTVFRIKHHIIIGARFIF